MTIDEVKEQLANVASRDRKLEYLSDELQRVSSIVTGGAVRYDKTLVQTSPRGDQLEEKVIKLLEIKEQILDLYIRQYEDKNRIMDALWEREDARYRQVLYLTYIKGKASAEVAEELGYTDSHVRHLNQAAIKEIARIWHDAD